jgi:thiol-disulfide isomerase/thioredoxin
LLGNILATEDYPIDFYAVYAGDDRQAWEAYVADRFDIESPSTRIHHLWDPQLDSDFQRKYGVVQTPRMFLIGPDQVIKGRGLDTYALTQMLGELFSYPELEYGSPQSEKLFDQLLSESVPSDIADHLAGRWLQSGDTTMCRQMAGDLLYYLAPKTGEDVKESMDYLIDEYILGRDDIWKSADDSVKVIGFAQIMDDLLSKSAPGSRIADIEVPGELLRHGKKIKSGTFNLRKIKGKNNIIIFYTEGCHICDAEKAAARKLVAENPAYRVLMVNVDRIMEADPSKAEILFDRFDLSTLPFILQPDRKGVIARRYISLQ